MQIRQRIAEWSKSIQIKTFQEDAGFRVSVASLFAKIRDSHFVTSVAYLSSLYKGEIDTKMLLLRVTEQYKELLISERNSTQFNLMCLLVVKGTIAYIESNIEESSEADQEPQQNSPEVSSFPRLCISNKKDQALKLELESDFYIAYIRTVMGNSIGTAPYKRLLNTYMRDKNSKKSHASPKLVHQSNNSELAHPEKVLTLPMKSASIGLRQCSDVVTKLLSGSRSRPKPNEREKITLSTPRHYESSFIQFSSSPTPCQIQEIASKPKITKLEPSLLKSNYRSLQIKIQKHWRREYVPQEDSSQQQKKTICALKEIISNIYQSKASQQKKMLSLPRLSVPFSSKNSAISTPNRMDFNCTTNQQNQQSGPKVVCLPQRLSEMSFCKLVFQQEAQNEVASLRLPAITSLLPANSYKLRKKHSEFLEESKQRSVELVDDPTSRRIKNILRQSSVVNIG